MASTTSSTADRAATLGELRESGYTPKSIREEMRDNLIASMRSGDDLFPGIVGYETTVIPAIENAILSGQDIILLGERGQAKTRMARSLVNLLDEYIPIVAGSEINDDPFHPISRYARDLIDEQGDATPIEWVGRDRALRREAGHAGHHDRRPDRRGRPDQGRRGSLSLRRADDLLRADPAHQPRHLRPQRAAGPGRADPGRPAQRHGGARRPDSRLQDPAAARCLRRRVGQPGGLHQPRPHHHPAQGPLRLADSHALPGDRSTSRSRSWSRSGIDLRHGGRRRHRARTS